MKYILDVMDMSLGYFRVFPIAASCLCNVRQLFYYDAAIS